MRGRRGGCSLVRSSRARVTGSDSCSMRCTSTTTVSAFAAPRAPPMSGRRDGDAFIGLAELADGAVDVVICDPPFDERTHRAALEVRSVDGRRSMSGRHAVALPFAALDDRQLDDVAAHLARVTRRWII